MRWLVVLTIVLTPGAAVAQGTSQAAAQCERLASLSLPNTTITAAQVVNAGAFVVPGSAPRRLTVVSAGNESHRAEFASSVGRS